jgi:hypothetical protein
LWKLIFMFFGVIFILFVSQKVGVAATATAMASSVSVASSSVAVGASTGAASASAGAGASAGTSATATATTTSTTTSSTASSSSSGSGSGDPVAVITSLQLITVCSKTTISTMPRNYRTFGSAFSFSNGNFGLYSTVDPTGAGQSQTAPEPDQSVGSNKALKAISSFDGVVYLVSDGKGPEVYFREIAIGFGLLLFFIGSLVVLQSIYVRNASLRTWQMQHRLNVSVWNFLLSRQATIFLLLFLNSHCFSLSLSLSLFCFLFSFISQKYRSYLVALAVIGYYGLISASLLIVTVNGNFTTVDIIFACTCLLAIGLPLPIVATYILRRHRSLTNVVDDVGNVTSPNGAVTNVSLAHVSRNHQVQNGPNATGNTPTVAAAEQRDTVVVFRYVIGGTRPGCEWYAVMNIYRRVCLACVSALLIDEPVWQCGLIVCIMVICFSVNLFVRPFDGGLSGKMFLGEAVCQVLAIVVCIIPLVCFYTTGHASETAGLVMVVMQLVAIIVVVCLQFPAALRSIRGSVDRLQRSLVRPSLEMPVDMVQPNRRASSATAVDIPETFYVALYRAIRDFGQVIKTVARQSSSESSIGSRNAGSSNSTTSSSSRALTSTQSINSNVSIPSVIIPAIDNEASQQLQETISPTRLPSPPVPLDSQQRKKFKFFFKSARVQENLPAIRHGSIQQARPNLIRQGSSSAAIAFFALSPRARDDVSTSSDAPRRMNFGAVEIVGLERDQAERDRNREWRVHRVSQLDTGSDVDVGQESLPNPDNQGISEGDDIEMATVLSNSSRPL